VSANNGANWTNIWNESGNKGDTWLNTSIDLAIYIGENIQLRFNRVTGETW
jgi:bacillopeptidase F (M6 metalloprotease family)